MRIYLDTVGCRLNQSEIEAYARQFRAAGHSLAPTPEQADLVIINTCTVTGEAASDSRGKIRQAQRAGAPRIILTGCWATLEPGTAAVMPGVERIIHNAAKDALVSEILQIPLKELKILSPDRIPIPGKRSRTRAFIKVQDGCDNNCTFCITRVARGPGRSCPLEEIITDIQAALLGGVQEVVLTGVHLGSWGADFHPDLHLSHLMKTILEETEIPRLHLSSVEPWDLEDDFFSLWERSNFNQRLCRHLHLPLQSGCERTLRRMARKTTPATYAALVRTARAAIPDVAITTDIIAGFPGEDEGEFMESLAFVREIGFAGGHVFTYSARPGTAAARLPGQVPHPIRKDRNAQMRSVLAEANLAYRKRFIGCTRPVLWESARLAEPQGWELSGLSDNSVRLSTYGPSNLWNQITPVRFVRLTEEGVWGEI